jgi:hypothetical protein
MDKKEAQATADYVCKMRLKLLADVKLAEGELLHLSREYGLDIPLS